MDKLQEIEVISRGIQYLDKLIALYVDTDSTLTTRCQELVERRENLVHCLLIVTNTNKRRRPS
jgi:hypothetical protein